MKTSTGFTLIELMVTLAIMVLLMTIGIPSLINLYEHIRADSAARVLQQTLQRGRNTAISYGIQVTICGLSDEGKCGANWQLGLSVFTDSGTVNQVDGSDKVLYQTGEFNAKDIVQYNRAAVRFKPDGLASGTNGTLKYCPGSETSSNSRAIVVNQAGRVRFSTEKAITCTND